MELFPISIPGLGQVFMINSFDRAEMQNMHSRQVYDILTLFGDVGGVVGFIMPIVSIFISGISEHAFNIKAITKLYIADTEDQNLFPLKTSQKSLKKQKKRS